jgi:hypothetical protein
MTAAHEAIGDQIRHHHNLNDWNQIMVNVTRTSSLGSVQRMGPTAVVCASGYDEPLTEPAYVKVEADRWFEIGTLHAFSDQDIAEIMDDHTRYRMVHAGVRSMRKYDTVNSAANLEAEADRLDTLGSDVTINAKGLRARASEILATLSD